MLLYGAIVGESSAMKMTNIECSTFYVECWTRKSDQYLHNLWVWCKGEKTMVAFSKGDPRFNLHFTYNAKFSFIAVISDGVRSDTRYRNEIILGYLLAYIY